MRYILFILSYVFSLLLFAPTAPAQTASLTGLVMDPSGAVLPGVTVWIVNQQTNIKNFVLTNDQGYYNFLGLSPAVYRLEAELPAFKRHVHPDITLEVDQAARIDISMQLGQPTEAVNVVLRSGTNSFHGSLFEFHRNSVFDARNFFDQEKSQLVRNNFGANLGGPVVKDMAFFFVNYEGWYLREGITRLQRSRHWRSGLRTSRRCFRASRSGIPSPGTA